jgi:hypothetical protein
MKNTPGRIIAEGLRIFKCRCQGCDADTGVTLLRGLLAQLRHVLRGELRSLAAEPARPDTPALKALLQREYRGFELPASLR